MDEINENKISCICGNDQWIIINNSINCSKCKLPKENIYLYKDNDPGELFREMKIPINSSNAIDLAKARLLRYKREGELLTRIVKIITENINAFYQGNE